MESPVLEAEVLQVHVPQSASKQKAADCAGPSAFSRVQRRRSFIKKKERPVVAPGDPSPGGEEATQDISVPKDIDLVGLPQLCFPGKCSDSVNQRLCSHSHTLHVSMRPVSDNHKHFYTSL